MDLKEWALIYVRHRDLAFRRIAKIEPTPFGFRIFNSDGSQSVCLVMSSLQEYRGVSGPVLVVVPNSPENIALAAKMWDLLISNPNLIVVFANPSSEDKWVLKPFLHDRVCDRKSLLAGLKAMAELVEPV